MVYLYAGLGMVMLSGIMAIFEMGLSLTGQSLLPTPADPYFADSSMKEIDQALLEFLFDQKKLPVQGVDMAFSELVKNDGLCDALNQIDDQLYPAQNNDWTLIREGRWINSCQLNRGSQRAVVKEDAEDRQMPYQLFSCALSGKDIWADPVSGIYRCSFESE